jgi:hypothetical protein
MARHATESGLDTLIERFQRVLPPLVAVLAEPTSRLSDLAQASEVVSVALAPDGLPSRIEVNPDWRRTVAAADLGRMVTDVCHRAATAHVEAVARAMSASGWTDRVAVMFASLAGGALPPGLAPPAVPPAPRAPAGSSRSLDAIVADLVQNSAAMDDVIASLDQPSDAAVVGTGGRGRLELRVGASGAVTCSADPEWVAGREVDELNAAFAAAVVELRAARDAGTAVPQRLLEANAQLAADLQALMDSSYAQGSAGG